MFCPKCGKQQLSEEIRFCAKCGLLLTPARDSLSGVNALAASNHQSQGLSPRAKGILQGVAIVPAGIGALALLDIFYEALGAGMLGGLYASLTIIVLVAIARIVYAISLEKGKAHDKVEASANSTPSSTISASPEPKAALSGATGEMVQPLSVTDHTTRQLHSNN